MGSGEGSRGEVVGLVPAAGRAERLGPLPCSKEILPLAAVGGGGPRVVCHHLLDAFRRAGVGRAFVVLRGGKWDVPAYLGSGAALGVRLAYLTVETTGNVPETLDAAYPFVAEARVALGFPDILFAPADAYTHLLARHDRGDAEVVLGLFPTDQGWKTDMVELGDGGRVRRIVVKEPQSGLADTWSIAVWGPRFTRFLHGFLASGRRPPGRELAVGDVLQAAVEEGWAVVGERFPAGRYLDVGTPEDLERAWRQGAAPREA